MREYVSKMGETPTTKAAQKMTRADVQNLIDKAVAKAAAKSAQSNGPQVLAMIRTSAAKAQGAKVTRDTKPDVQNVAQFFAAPPKNQGPAKYDGSIVDAMQNEMYRQRKGT